MVKSTCSMVKSHWSYHFASSFPGGFTGFTIRQVIPDDYIVSVNGNSTIDKMKEHLLQSLVSLADFADFKPMVLENVVGTWGWCSDFFNSWRCNHSCRGYTTGYIMLYPYKYHSCRGYIHHYPTTSCWAPWFFNAKAQLLANLWSPTGCAPR